MRSLHFRLLLSIFLIAGVSFTVHAEEPAANSTMMEVSLYTGIPGLAHLGESAQSVERNAKGKFTREDLEPGSELGKLGFTFYYYFQSLGSKVYFKRDGVGLITLQEPFKGTIKGKKIKLFAFSVPPVSDWETLLMKEFGPPDARAAGGRLGSEALFYIWGDLSYNRMGPNELALYRNQELSKYRLTHFGRELNLFPKK